MRMSAKLKTTLEISLPRRSPAFMILGSTSPTGPIVVVEVEAFRKRWALTHDHSQRLLARGDEEQLRKDRKFGDAEIGFSHGRVNPVPITQLCVGPTFAPAPKGSWLNRLLGQEERTEKFIRTTGNSFSFVNGVTRTIWLIAEGARCIPFICQSEEDAEMVETLAGASTELANANVRVLPPRPSPAEEFQVQI